MAVVCIRYLARPLMLKMLIRFGTGFALVPQIRKSVRYLVQCAFRATKIKLIIIILPFG